MSDMKKISTTKVVIFLRC